MHDVISEEISCDDNDYIDENNIGSSTASNECSQQISVQSDSSQCPECNDVFSHRNHRLRHVTYAHQGVRYPCNLCDHKATHQADLKRHIKSVHEGVEYPCSNCDYKAARRDTLKKHIDSKHEC